MHKFNFYSQWFLSSQWYLLICFSKVFWFLIFFPHSLQGMPPTSSLAAFDLVIIFKGVVWKWGWSRFLPPFLFIIPWTDQHTKTSPKTSILHQGKFFIYILGNQYIILNNNLLQILYTVIIILPAAKHLSHRIRKHVSSSTVSSDVCRTMLTYMNFDNYLTAMKVFISFHNLRSCEINNWA